MAREIPIRISVDGRQAQAATAGVASSMATLKQRADGAGQSTSRVSRGLDSLRATASAAAPAVAAVGTAVAGIAFVQAVRQTAQFERQLAEISKTTGITGKSLTNLGRNIQDIGQDIPVATDRLLSFATAAGQLGVTGTKNIEQFTRTLGQLELATDIAGEQGARSLSRILNVTGAATSEIDRLGSALVGLGNNFAATESEIVNTSRFLASSTAQFDLTTQQVVGLSAGLQALGQRAESSGSSVGKALSEINKAIQNGGKNLQTLTDLTGKSVAELRRQFEDNATSVLLDFTEALRGVSDSRFPKILEEFSLAGLQTKRVINALVQGNDELRRALEKANVAWRENTAAQDEAAKAGDTLEGDFTRLSNSINELMTQEDGLPAVRSAVQELNELLQDPSFQQGFDNFVSGVATLARWSAGAAAGLGNLGKAMGDTAGRIVAGEFGAERINSELNQVNKQVELLTNRLFALRNQLEQTPEGSRRFRQLRANIEGTRSALEEARAKQADLRKELERFTPTVDKNTEAQVDMRDVMKEVNAQLERLEEFSENAGEGVDKLTGRVISSQKRMEEFQKSINRVFTTPLEASGGNFGPNDAIVNRNIETAEQVLNRTKDAADDVKDKIKDTEEASRESAGVFAQVFEDAATDIGRSITDEIRGELEGLPDIFRDVISQLISIAAQRQIVVPIVAKTGGALGLGQDQISGIVQQLGGGNGLSGFGGGSLIPTAGELANFAPGIFGGGVASSGGAAFANTLAGTSAPNALGSAAGGALGALPAAALAGTLGSEIFGEGGGTGSSLGTVAAGAAGFGPIGLAVGGLLGGALGGELFGDSKPDDADFRAGLGVSGLGRGGDVTAGPAGSLFRQDRGGKLSDSKARQLETFIADFVGQRIAAIDRALIETTGEALEEQASFSVNIDRFLQKTDGPKDAAKRVLGPFIRQIAQDIDQGVIQEELSRLASLRNRDKIFQGVERFLGQLSSLASVDALDQLDEIGRANIGAFVQATQQRQQFLRSTETQEQRLERFREQINAANEQLGRTGENAIDTTKELREFVQGLDLTTESGRAAQQRAMQLTEAIRAVEQASQSAAEAEQSLAETRSQAEIQRIRERGLEFLRRDESPRATVERINNEFGTQIQSIQQLNDAIRSLDPATVENPERILAAARTLDEAFRAINQSEQRAAERARSARANRDQFLRRDETPEEAVARINNALDTSIQSQSGLNDFVRSLDLTTEAGRQAFRQAQSLASALDRLSQAEQQAAQQAERRRQAVESALNDSLSNFRDASRTLGQALDSRISELQQRQEALNANVADAREQLEQARAQQRQEQADSLRETISAAQEAADAWRGVIADAESARRALTVSSAQDRGAALREQFERSLQAVFRGDTEAAQNLGSQAQSLAEQVRGQANSAFEARSGVAAIQNQLRDAESVAGSRAGAQERIARNAEQQLSALKQTSETTITIAEAQRQLAQAQAARDQANLQQQIEQLEAERNQITLLDREVTLSQARNRFEQARTALERTFQQQDITLLSQQNSILVQIRDVLRSSSGGPQLADGGIVSGPRSGFSATLHGTEAVIPMDGRSIPVNVNNGAVVAEIRAMREELGTVSRRQQQESRKVRKIVEKFDIDGLPQTRTA